jgi:NADPH:quinone reductase-like Zn-dependent oxidoreductase
MTAWQGLFSHGQLKQEQTVLIHAGSGGVAHFAVQLAKVHGATALATASKDDLEFASSLGADIVIDYQRQAFETVAKDADIVFT